jgi:glycosyltransferase involved in cell wall biosynthesis
MKILHLLYESKGDYFGIGGVGVRAYEIYKYLKDRHNITLLCKKYLGAEDREIEGIRHIFVGAENKSLTKTLLSYAYHATRFVKKYGDNFDIIIEEFSPAIPTFLHTFTKKPIVLQIQGYTGVRYFEKYNIFYSGILYIFERLLPLFYRNIIVVSYITKKRYHFNNRNKKIEVISNGIPEELLSYNSGESDYILYLGRIDIHHKGLDILLDAYREFYKIFPHIGLVIAGDGRDREKFLALIQKLPGAIQKNIELSGWADDKKKVHLLRNALMVIMPSRYETQGIVALEAMACGKPLVVSDIPELRYVMQSEAGISFKTGDALSLAQSMKDLMATSERKEMGQRGREYVKGFTWDRIALKYEQFLHEVVEKDKGDQKE